MYSFSLAQQTYKMNSSVSFERDRVGNRFRYEVEPLDWRQCQEESLREFVLVLCETEELTSDKSVEGQDTSNMTRSTSLNINQ